MVPKKVKKPSLTALIKKVINRQAETKQATTTYSDYQEISHNNMLILSSSLLNTSQGVGDPQTNNQSCRIGDELQLKGLSIKLHLELNERYSQTTFRIMVIKSPATDGLNSAILFQGQSDNKMLDTINNEKCKVISQRYITIYAGNKGSRTGPATTLIGSGINGGTDIGGGATLNDFLYSRSSKIVKLWIPGNRFVKNGKVRYQNNSQSPITYGYYLVVYAYSSNATSTAGEWKVGAVNDCITTMYFKDF